MTKISLKQIQESTVLHISQNTQRTGCHRKLLMETRRIRFRKKNKTRRQNHEQVQSTNYQSRAGMCSNISYTATTDAERMHEKRLQKTTSLPFKDSTLFCNKWLNRGLKCNNGFTPQGTSILRCTVPFTSPLMLYRT